jgi:hypothetical protein
MPDLADPFRLTDDHHQKERQAQEKKGGRLAGKYEAGEHQWLGMRGATLACQQLGEDPASLRRLRRRAGDVELGYGEIVALSGDFYGSPEALFDEQPSPLPWLYEKNDLSDLRKLFAAELTWIMDEQRPRNAGYPDNTLAFMWNAKSYLELAEDNTAHFGWHNVVAYCKHHQQAIAEAQKARTRDAGDESWLRALYYNGFADHFLTDGFAAGHLRIPRAQIRAWAAQHGYSGKLAGLLSKVLHDQDGHVSSLHAQGEAELPDSEGLPVRNSLGIDWSTRCDGQLFLVPTKESAPLIAEPVAAVAASLVELYTAQTQRRAPTGAYAALQHVPFPRPGAPTLAQKFEDASPARIEQLLGSFRWYTKLPLIEASLDRENVGALFAALPDLMKQFALEVSGDLAASAELRERLPRPYADAYRAIG